MSDYDNDGPEPSPEAIRKAAQRAGVWLTREQIIEHTLRFDREYRAEGLDPTARQIYYRFVSTGVLHPSLLRGKKAAFRAYKRIVDTLAEARLRGDFPLDRMVDNLRDVQAGDFTRIDLDVDRALDGAVPLVRAIPDMLLDVDRWQGQEAFVSVWVEKDAMAGVFERPCRELGVSWLVCRGYPSVSVLWQWLKRASEVCGGGGDRYLTWGGAMETTERHEGVAKHCVVLYFGDHDPDGLEIPKAAARTIEQIRQLKGLDLEIEFKRVGLNMDQIKRYRPPPFEAKVDSARFKGYVAETGTTDAWELDALEPRVLRDLIRTNVRRYFDEDVYNEQVARRDAARAALRAKLAKPAFLRRALREES